MLPAVRGLPPLEKPQVEAGNVVDVTLGGMTALQLAQKLDQYFGVAP